MRVNVAIFLVLSHVFFSSAFPFWGTTTTTASDESAGSDNVMMEEEGSGASGESGEGEDPIVTTQLPVMNDYVFRFFLSQRELKETNCTTQFLGQNVSRHLCNSNKVLFLFPEGKKQHNKHSNKITIYKLPY